MKSAKWIKENESDEFIEVHNKRIKEYEFYSEMPYETGESLFIKKHLNDYFSKYERKVVK